jgi:type I restriction enzyme, S subunit
VSLPRLRYFATVNPPTPEFLTLPQDYECSFLPLEAVWPDGRLNTEATRCVEDGFGSYNFVREGDILVPKVTPTFEHNRVAIADSLAGGLALATTEVHTVRVHDESHRRFLHYRLRAADFQQFGKASMIGVAGLQRVPAAVLLNLPIYPAALENRARLVAFLDQECHRINRLGVARGGGGGTLLGRLGSLLIEYRDALITEAVTGDLDVARLSEPQLEEGAHAAAEGAKPEILQA